MCASAPPPAGLDPSVCQRCASRGHTCCRLAPGEEEVCFPLSEMERDRILDQSHDKGAFVQEANSAPFRDNLFRLFPRERELLEQLFPENKTHLRLATRPDGACVFVGPQGCSLPREARPYYCLLFPFWLLDDRMTTFTPDGCLAVAESRTLSQMLRLIGMTEAEVRLLHGRLRLAWGLPPKEGLPLLTQSFRRYTKS